MNKHTGLRLVLLGLVPLSFGFALATGSVAHMPHMPMSDVDAGALAHYLITVTK